jgi:hypothetical protein
LSNTKIVLFLLEFVRYLGASLSINAILSMLVKSLTVFWITQGLPYYYVQDGYSCIFHGLVTFPFISFAFSFLICCRQGMGPALRQKNESENWTGWQPGWKLL